MSLDLNPIVVTITGPNAAGKTSLLAVIQTALENAGLPSSNIVIQGCDTSPLAYTEFKHKIAESGLPESVRERTVHLVESYEKK